MKKRFITSTGMFLSGLLLITPLSAFAQERAADKAAVEQSVVLTRQLMMQSPQDPQSPLPPDNFVFIASEMNFDGELVKGAPYSAQAVTENIQTLSDGNRIVNKTTTSVFRDSEGRTRREHTLTALGPFANGGEPSQTISISDPVAGVSYALDPHTKVAHKMLPMRFNFKIAGSGETRVITTVSPDGPNVAATTGVSAAPAGSRTEIQIERAPGPPPPPPGERGEGQIFMRHTPGPGDEAQGVVMAWKGESKQAKTESLGKQTIEGVEAEGTRTTFTIPAGEIGNERAIEMVSERWFSPELKVVVMTRHSDPRFGETTYRLTNINRAEQPKSLFEVPADYTVKEGPSQAPLMKTMKMRKPGGDQ